MKALESITPRNINLAGLRSSLLSRVQQTKGQLFLRKDRIMKTQNIDWSKATIKDYEFARDIVARANNIKGFGKADVMSLQMDIVATHISGCKLKLQELLSAEVGNFLHDVCGIMRHLDRTTGKLQDCFVPRYAS